MRNYPSFERAAAEAVQQSERIDYLFNNAGIVSAVRSTHTRSMTGDVFDVNLRGVVHGIQAVYPTMIQQHSGQIVNTASMAGLVTGAGPGELHRDQTRRRRDLEGPAARGERQACRCRALSRRDPDPDPRRRPVRTNQRPASATSHILKSWEQLRPMAPEIFAERALRAVFRGDAIIAVPAWWKPWWYLNPSLPALSMRVPRVMVKRGRELDPTAS